MNTFVTLRCWISHCLHQILSDYIYLSSCFLNGVPQHESFSQSGKWLKQGDPSSSIILWIIVDYFWTRDEHSLSVGWSLFLLDDSQIDHPQFYVCCFHNSLQVLPGFVQFTLERPPTETRVLRSHRCPKLFEGTGGKKQQLYQPPPMIFPWNRPNHSSIFQSWQFSPVKACLGPDKGGARRDPRTAEIMQLSVPGNEGAWSQESSRFWEDLGRLGKWKNMILQSVRVYVQDCSSLNRIVSQDPLHP